MELVDFDGLFDKKLTEYMKKNPKKRTEKEWEDVIPELYKKFGDTYLPKYGCTPRQYYARMDDREVVETLKKHLSEKVPVPEFLCSEIEKRDVAEQILPLIDDKDEETVLYAIHFIGEDERAFDAYFTALQSGKKGEDAENEMTDCLKGVADKVKERALALFKEAKKSENENAERLAEYMIEILSRVKERDEEIFTILCEAFSSDESKMPMRASYLAEYGDERALPLLLKRIENREIGFTEFRELKYAVERLGGEYNEPRTFEHDDDFLKVEDMSEKEGFTQIGDLS